MMSWTLCSTGNPMQRTITIIDETNNISCRVVLDEEKQFLQVWGIDAVGEKNIVVEKIEHGFKRSPFVVQARVISEHAGRVPDFKKNMEIFER